MPGRHWEFVRRSSRVAEKLIGRFHFHPKKIGSGHRWISVKKTQGVDVGQVDSAISYLDIEPAAIFILEHQSGSNLAIHKVVGAPGLDDDGDRSLLKKSFNFHCLGVRIAGYSVSHAIGQLRVYLRVLLMLEVLLFMFRFFNGFNHEKSPLSAMMVVAPQLVTMPA
ncbi:hypothetical protein GW17_00014952 [Ensete ventricosum]|nr:hypothetical protein GW17_00014952 [Ensete ventricosum]